MFSILIILLIKLMKIEKKDRRIQRNYQQLRIISRNAICCFKIGK